MVMFIGIDGGHDKSHTSCFDSDTGNGFMFEGRPVNLHLLSKDAWDMNLRNLLETVAVRAKRCKWLQISKQSRVCLCLAGVTADVKSGDLHTELLRKLCLSHDDHFSVIDDTWAVIIQNSAGSDLRGVCAFADVGASVTIALGEGELNPENKIDGWGPVIGDFGSLVQLAIDFLRTAGRCLDKKQELVAYKYLVERYPGRLKLPETPGELQEWFDDLRSHDRGTWHLQLAELGRGLVKYSEAFPDDVFVGNLLEKSASDLLESICIASTRTNERLPISLFGEMFSSTLYRQRVEVVLNQSCRYTKLVPPPQKNPEFIPAFGAVKRAALGVLRSVPTEQFELQTKNYRW